MPAAGALINVRSVPLTDTLSSDIVAAPELLIAIVCFAVPPLFGLDPNLPTLLVSGGSQGARRLNEVVQQVAPYLQQAGIQILQTVQAAREPAVGGIASYHTAYLVGAAVAGLGVVAALFVRSSTRRVHATHDRAVQAPAEAFEPA